MKRSHLILSLVLSLGIVAIAKGNASAATINVSAGTDTIAVDSTCHLSEAIQNINDQAQTNQDCPAGDGDNDTINLPAGTITLSDDLPLIVQSVIIQGQGMGETVIDGNGTHRVFNIVSVASVFRGLTVTAFNDDAVQAIDSNIIVEQIEVDGTGSNAAISSLHGFEVSGMGGGNYETSFKDVYVHNLPALTSRVTVGISIGAVGESSFDATVENVTITEIAGNGTQGSIGIFFGSGFTNDELTSGSLTATLTNSSITNITSETLANGVAAASIVNGGQGDVQINAKNTTINDINGQVSSRVVAAGGAAFGTEDLVSTAINLTNVIVNGQCEASVLMLGPTPAGTQNLSIGSLGGNLSEDESCNDYFTHPTDQTEVAGLADSLGSLSDNGGSVPTIPLLPGSPAIDAGVPVVGLTTDARGITRPQCAAYDSGAYEYNGTCQETSSDSDPISDIVEDAAPGNGDGNNDGTPDSQQAHVTSLPIPSGPLANTYITLVSPEGTTISATTIEQATDLATQDTAFNYPLGLLSFTIDDLTPGTTIPIELYYYTDQSPDSFIPRKYNPTTQAFTTLSTQTNTTLTQQTINNQSVLKLTYNLTDGGSLDIDNQANGSIQDPVGLAEQTTGSADTGLPTHWLLGVKG